MCRTGEVYSSLMHVQQWIRVDFSTTCAVQQSTVPFTSSIISKNIGVSAFSLLLQWSTVLSTTLHQSTILSTTVHWSTVLSATLHWGTVLSTIYVATEHSALH